MKEVGMDKLKQNVESLPCDRHAELIGETRKDVDVLKALLDAQTFVQSHSPLSPTEEGLEAIRYANLDQLLVRAWPAVKRDLDCQNLSNPYDIQERAMWQVMRSPEQFLTDVEIDRLKTVAYEHGKNLHSYLQLLGLLARDRYLAERSGLSALR